MLLDENAANQENGAIIEKFFYFRKKIMGGTYQYHLFPTLDLLMIEDSDLMKTFDRNKYIS